MHGIMQKSLNCDLYDSWDYYNLNKRYFLERNHPNHKNYANHSSDIGIIE
jgi:hypothetical protein